MKGNIPSYRLLIQPFAELDRITEVAEYRTTARVKPEVYHLYRWIFVMKNPATSAAFSKVFSNGNAASFKIPSSMLYLQPSSEEEQP